MVLVMSMTDWSHTTVRESAGAQGEMIIVGVLNKQLVCGFAGSAVLSARAEPGPTCDDGHSKKVPKLIEQSNW